MPIACVKMHRLCKLCAYCVHSGGAGATVRLTLGVRWAANLSADVVEVVVTTLVVRRADVNARNAVSWELVGQIDERPGALFVLVE